MAGIFKHKENGELIISSSNGESIDIIGPNRSEPTFHYKVRDLRQYEKYKGNIKIKYISGDIITTTYNKKHIFLYNKNVQSKHVYFSRNNDGSFSLNSLPSFNNRYVDSNVNNGNGINMYADFEINKGKLIIR
jgi:hypothetical protein